MKIITKTTSLLLACLAIKSTMPAQCGSIMPLGSAFNMITQIKNCTNPVVADKDLNTAVFIHRNSTAAFGGSTGNFRYDLSTNGGTSWTNNLGVLNPLTTNSNAGRYPNAVIYNPSGNVNPTSAYLGYLGSTTNVNTGVWAGVVTGVRQLSGSGNTETYNQPGSSSYLVASSMVKGAPGIFWAANLGASGNYPNGIINVYKGTWNGSNNIIWATNASFSPSLDNSYTGNAIIDDVNIAFDPAGTKGWLCIMGHPLGQFLYAYAPIFYKTLNGGQSWQGPYPIDVSQFACVNANIPSGLIPACHSMSDLTVDLNGNPHLLTTIGVGNDTYGIEDNMYHHMFDITQMNGNWNAYDIANVNGSPALYNGSVSSTVTQAMSPQVARSADGTKIFFGWSDNSNYSLGTPNTSPNLFARGFDVQQNKWTTIKDFSSCNPTANGKVFFPHFAAEVLEPTANVYKIAPVYGEFLVGTDPDQGANFKFLDNVTFNASEFTGNLNAITVAITPTNVSVCPGTPVNLQISGNYSSILWSNGSTGLQTSVSAGGIYSVTVQTGCSTGSGTVSVGTTTVSASANNAVVCSGNAVALTAAGNGFGYSWSPDATIGANITVFPTATTNYVVTTSGYQNCTVTAAVTVSVDACTGIADNVYNTGAFSVYPNPNNGNLTLSADADLTLQLSDALGKPVMTIRLSGDNNHQVNLSGLSKGIYILSGINEGKQNVYRKIVVE